MLEHPGNTDQRSRGRKRPGLEDGATSRRGESAPDTPSPVVQDLRRQRNRRNWNLNTLSARTGKAPQHLSEIELGRRDPRLSSIEALARAMGMSLVLVPDHLFVDVNRYIENNGRSYTIPGAHRGLQEYP